MTDNPYSADAALSSCFRWEKGKLVACFNGQAAKPKAIHIHHMFRALIESPEFPCYGAKAALNKNTYRFGFYGAMDDPQTLKALCHDLYEFSREQKEIGGDFTTFAACFDQTSPPDATHFEDAVWKLLGNLCTADSPHSLWDPVASPDPEQPDFSFSFGGTAYFVAALSPVSLRISRQFMAPVLVFNAHYQFQNMREKGIYDSLRDKIRKKDTALENGMPNTLSAGFGETSGAIQYCGIPAQNGKNWQCPFHKYFKPF